MTNFRTTLFAAAATLALISAPAFANHHEESTIKDGAKMMKTDVPEGYHRMPDGSLMKNADMMKKDSMNTMEDGTMMESETMMKSSTTMSVPSMTIEQRMAAEKRLMKAMTKTERAEFLKLAPQGRKAWMNKKLSGDYMPMRGTMTNDSMTTGQVLQMNEPINPTMGDDDVLMSRGATPDVDRALAVDGDGTLKDNAIVVPTVGSNVLTTVSCPAGSEAQPNGTCMLTGDNDLMNFGATGTQSSMSTSTSMTTSGMSDTSMTTQSTGRFTTDGRPYMGTLDPATAFGNR